MNSYRRGTEATPRYGLGLSPGCKRQPLKQYTEIYPRSPAQADAKMANSGYNSVKTLTEALRILQAGLDVWTRCPVTKVVH